MEESFANLLREQQRGGGQLSVSHDSVFPGEMLPHHTRPLSSLDLPASTSLEVKNVSPIVTSSCKVAIIEREREREMNKKEEQAAG